MARIGEIFKITESLIELTVYELTVSDVCELISSRCVQKYTEENTIQLNGMV